MTIRIHVTKDILEKAMYCGINPETGNKLKNEISNIGSNCGIGVAVRELFPNAWVSNSSIWLFDITPDYNYVMGRPPHIYISLPIEAKAFIRRFDFFKPEDRVNMTPVSFNIDVPDEVINRIGIQEVESILSNSLTLEKV